MAKPGKRPFRPTVKHQRYLSVFLQLLAARTYPSYEAIARELGVSRQSAYTMGTRPAFMEWRNARVDEATGYMWSAICHSAAHLAVRGSIDHANFLAKVLGKLPQTAADTPGSPSAIASAQVNLLVPGPDGTWALQPPGRPLPLPAAVAKLASRSDT